MNNDPIQEEIAIIIKQAETVNIKDSDDIVAAVKLAIAAADRLIIHASTLYNQSAVQQENLNGLTKNVDALRISTENLVQKSDQTWSKAQRATRIALTTLLFLLVVISGFLWNQIPSTYKIVAISAAAGWLIPKLAGWFWDEFRS